MEYGILLAHQIIKEGSYDILHLYVDAFIIMGHKALPTYIPLICPLTTSKKFPIMKVAISITPFNHGMLSLQPHIELKKQRHSASTKYAIILVP